MEDKFSRSGQTSFRIPEHREQLARKKHVSKYAQLALGLNDGHTYLPISP
jgi:hypothetical protein